MEVKRSKHASFLLGTALAALLSQTLFAPVISAANFEDQKNYYTPDPNARSPPPVTYTPPAHGPGGHHATPTPSHGTPSHGGTPPANCGKPLAQGITIPLHPLPLVVVVDITIPPNLNPYYTNYSNTKHSNTKHPNTDHRDSTNHCNTTNHSHHHSRNTNHPRHHNTITAISV
ncbi:UNVERIFIED_CONTAM: hypothetical protein Sradi_2308800 [Sesamum radiatum]|uniref:Uncharacterized protein n=1 Tax=Sesamum radiatum TaxID=300843 RepID=A0AAW2T4B6_SESRA